ncbi:hypothetical protein ES705_16318 [subsurface metagenome]
MFFAKSIAQLYDYIDAQVTALTESIAELKWYDRGDLTNYDYQSVDLTKDGFYQLLDLSAIIGTGKKLLCIRVRINDSAGGKAAKFRTYGNEYETNMGVAYTQVANKTCEQNVWVYCDIDGKIEYAFDSATWNVIALCVRGWFN